MAAKQKGKTEESSATTKRGRGRPRAYNKDIVEFLIVTSGRRTERGAVEYDKASTVWGIIQDCYKADRKANAWAEYYIDPKGRDVFHVSIMSALGRLDDPDRILRMAREIAEKRVSTRAAVAWIRRCRFADGSRAVGTAAQLRQELLRACNDFLARYPDTDRDGIVEAVDRFREDVQRSLL
jgi:hypothetical protein